MSAMRVYSHIAECSLSYAKIDIFASFSHTYCDIILYFCK